MSIIAHSENASQSALASGQIGPGEGTARKIRAESSQAATATTKSQTRRAKSNALRAVGSAATPEVLDAPELVPSTPTSTNHPKKSSKQDIVLGLLRQTEGATIDELMDATAWQPHSLRGFLSGTVRKKLKLHLISDVVGNGVRRYRVASTDQAIRSSEAGDQPTTDGSAGLRGA